MYQFNPYTVIKNHTHIYVVYYGDIVYNAKIWDNPHKKINEFLESKNPGVP